MANKKSTPSIPVGQQVGFVPLEGNYVSDVSFYTRPEQAAPAPVQPTGFLRSVGDSAVALGSGVVQGVKMVSDVFGAGNQVSQALGDVTQGMQSLYSPQRQAEMQRRQAIIAEAEKQGIGAEVAAYLGAAAEAPLDTVLNALGTMFPTLLTGGLGAAARLGSVGTKALTAVTGATQGAGSVKGNIYDAVQQRAVKEGKSPEEAAALADQAQAYTGQNADQIALGAGLGTLASMGPVEKMAGLFTKKGAQEAATGFTGSMPTRMAKAAGAEAIPEGLQGAQEQFASNLAQQRQGYDQPLMQGVFGSGALEAVAAWPLGAAAGIRAPQVVPETGPLSRAANAGAAATPPAPPPVSLSESDSKGLLDFANLRFRALEEKANGTKDQTITGPDGKKVTVPGKPAEFLTPEEKSEREFLAQNGGDAQALAKAYGYTPSNMTQQGEADLMGQMEAQNKADQQLVKDFSKPRSKPTVAEPANQTAQNTAPTEPKPFKSKKAAEKYRNTQRDPSAFEVAQEGDVFVVRPIVGFGEITGDEDGSVGGDAPAGPTDEGSVSGNPGLAVGSGVGADGAGSVGSDAAASVDGAGSSGGAADVRPGTDGAAAKLSRELAGTKPNYAIGDKKFSLSFESDIDKALFITSQATPSKRDADYRQFLKDNGYTDEQIAQEGKAIRDRIKAQAKGAQPGELRIGKAAPVVTQPTATARPAETSAAAQTEQQAATEAPAAPAINPQQQWDGMTPEQRMGVLMQAGWKSPNSESAKAASNQSWDKLGKKRDKIGAAMAGMSAPAPAVSDTQPAKTKADGAVVPTERVKSDTLPVAGGTSAAPYYILNPGKQDGSRISVQSPEDAATKLAEFSRTTGWKPADGGLDIFDAATGQPAFNIKPDGSFKKVESMDEARARAEASAEKPTDDLDAMFDDVLAEEVAAQGGKSTKTPLTKQDTKPLLDPSDSPAVNDYLEGRRDTPPTMDEVAAEGKWDQSTPEQRKQMLRDAGYSDGDQLQAFSGSRWADLGEFVRGNLLAGKKSGQQDDTLADPEMAAYEGGKTAETRAQDKQRVADAAKPKPSANTVFTEDAAAAARARLKAKLNRLNSGIDPETMMDGIILAGYHIEKGARTFAAYAKAMVADLGDAVKPYLKSWYMGVRFDPRATAFAGDMDSAASVESADVDKVLAEDKPAKPTESGKPSIEGPEGRNAVAQSVADHLIGGNRFANIVEARKFISDLTGQKIEPGTRQAKLADETIEIGVVLAARDIVRSGRKQGRSDEVIYDRLVSLYESQPSLNVRDSDSIREQAYSTPAPLAFVASRLAQIKNTDKVGEPTAGNSMLLMEVSQDNAKVSELNDARTANLRAMGFAVQQGNAAVNPLADPNTLDAVVMNPPFGVTRDADGKTIQYTITPNYETGEIDHAIVFKALEAMKDDGNAVLIIGGTLAESDEGRKDAYRSKAKREFFYNLYNAYNVVDHFTAGGDLYKKQGTTYPVDVLVIRGRGKSDRKLPAADLPTLITSWDQLKEKLSAQYDGMGSSGADGVGGNRDIDQASRPNDGGLLGQPGVPNQGNGQPSNTGRDGAGAGTADAGGTPGRANRPGSGRNDAAVGEPSDQAGTDGDGRAGADARTDSQDGQVGGASNPASRPAGVDAGAGKPVDRARLTSEDAEKLQVSYTNFSGNKPVGTLVATNQLAALQDAFAALRERVGDIDEFVRGELQYSPEDFKKSFSAEQVEALALAINNIGQGKAFIIGDQTGIGKGRVVAAMIRYAKLKGKTPIFVTQMPDLYGDMMRDLTDIQMGGFKPLMTNNNAAVPLDNVALEWFSEKQAINTRITELQEAIEDLVAEDLGDARKEMTAAQFSVEVKRQTKNSTNPEIVSLRNEIAELRESMPPRRGKFLETPSIEQHETALRQMVESNSIGDYDAIFTTYDQLSPLDSGKPKTDKDGRQIPAKSPTLAYRNQFLQHFAAENSMLILDESHNAGRVDPGQKFLTRAEIIRELIRKAGSVFYSSATFAKDPGMMDAYNRTDLGLLGDFSMTIPQQQVASAMLTAAGQYIRRERSFDGIEYKSESVKVDKESTDALATSMRMMVEFDDLKKSALADIQADLDAEGAVIAATGGGGSAGSVESTNFTGVMHNVVNTFLLALKADAAAESAIEAIRRGEKPVLTVANTMEMFITEFSEEAGIAIGDPINATFADVLMRYLEKTRYARIRHADGTKEKIRLSDAQLGPEAVQAFEDAKEFIQSLKLDIPLSPIDRIKQRIQQAGFSIGEVTGRQTVVIDGVRRNRPKVEMGTAGKKNTIAKFNNGQLDALIINRSGSTGLSMHASEKFDDQRRRVMVIAQAELDINNHMQMLGRVNRTGQVTEAPAVLPEGAATFGLPRYVQLTADVPIELRPAAVLAKKMASLNANTTSGKKSAVEDKAALDFMNKYGDLVAAQLMVGDPDLNKMLGTPVVVDPNTGDYNPTGAMAKVTGRVGLLPLKQQTEIYDRLTDEYRVLIAQLEATGRNDLEAKTLPLDARQVETRTVMEMTGPSPFQSAVEATVFDVKKLGKPYTTEAVRNLIADALGGKTGAQVRSSILADYDKELQAEISAIQLDAASKNKPEVTTSANRRIDKLRATATAFRANLPTLGSPVVLKTDAGNIYGIPFEISKPKGAKNSLAPSGWRVKFAVVDGSRTMTFAMSQITTGQTSDPNAVVYESANYMVVPNADRTGFDEVPVLEGFDRGQSDSRERRVILTGNLLAATKNRVFPGRIISFVTAEGEVKQGFIVAPTFDLAAAEARLTPDLTDPDQMVAFLDNGGIIIDRDKTGDVFKAELKGPRYVITTSKTGAGKRISSDLSLYMTSVGNKMRGQLYADQADTKDRLKAFLREVVSAPINLKLTTTSATKDLLPKLSRNFGYNNRAAGISRRDAQAAADLIRREMPSAPEIILLDKIEDAPPVLYRKITQSGAERDVEAAYYDGKIYAFPANFDDVERFRFVVGRHEVRHAGFDAMLGDQRDAVLLSIARANRALMMQAKERQREGRDGSLVESIEEVLADTPVEDLAKLTRIKALVAAVRQWLRDTAFKLRKAGFKTLADAIEPRMWTDNDVLAFVLKAEDVSRGPGGGGGGGKDASLSRGGVAQTATPQFKRWFGKSKVVDAEGKPLVVYHGTTRKFTVFQPDRALGWGTGIYLTDNREQARDEYGDGQDDNVMSVYVSMQNPWRDTMGYGVLRIEESKAWDEYARSKGVRPPSDPDYDPDIDGLSVDRAIEEDGELINRVIRERGYDGIIADSSNNINGLEIVAFRPEQIKSATGNNGNFDPENPDIRFSRRPTEAVRDAALRSADAMKEVGLMAGYKVGDFMQSSGTLSWWDKTVGTPYNLAKRNPRTFGRVYDAVQGFLSDISAYANHAADLAPNILPRLENLSDIGKQPISAEDNKAIAAPIFEGTLNWTRRGGKLMTMEQAEAQAEAMDVQDKAQELVRMRLLDPKVLRMWQGLPLDQYESAINTRYRNEMLRPGVVWSDAELRDKFKLTDNQIKLYREFRQAVDRSLDDLAISEMRKLVGDEVQADIEGLDAYGASEAYRQAIAEAIKATPERGGTLDKLADKLVLVGNRIKDLKERGYAPLSRFGHHTLDVVQNGERVYFGMFESKAEANKMARQMAQQFPEADITQGTQSQEDYKRFAGVTPETLEIFGSILGLDADGDSASDQVFQEYLRKATATRSALRRLIHRKGTAGFSEDVGRVLSSFITSNARRTASNLNARNIALSLDAVPREQGQMRDYAIKMAEYVQNPQEEAQAIRSVMFAQYLGGSIASALVNMTQPVTVTMPYLSQFGGAKKAAAAITTAFKDAAKQNYEADLKEALERDDVQAVVDPQEIHQLQAQSRGVGSLRSGDGTKAGDALAKGQNALAKVSLAWGKLFGMAELINRRVTFIAAYRMAKANGNADPVKFAIDAINETQFTYNKGNRPQWARGAIGATLFTFKSYSVSYVELLARNWKLGGPEGKKAVMLAMAVMFLMSGADEFPFMEDAEDVIDGFMQRVMGRNWSTKQKRNEWLAETFGQGAADFIAKGVSGLPGVPIDVSGRFGMGNLIPGTGLLRKDSRGLKDATEVLGPIADLATRGATAVGYALQGDVLKAAKEASPVAARNVFQAADMAETGMYRDTKGRKVVDADLGDVVSKAIGFQPNAIARVQDATATQQRTIALNKVTEAEIADLWAQGRFENDPAKVEEAKERLRKWNEDNPETPIRIKMQQIIKRVREMSLDKAQRLEKTAPKEIRASVREALAER